jgi:thymidylate synthase
MRSNDIVRGFPYNVVQFTTVQEIVAGWLGVELGPYNHWSDSLHIYEADLPDFSAACECEPELNSESLMMAAHEGERLITELYERLQKFSDDSLTRIEFGCLTDVNAMPRGYQSLVSILAAEAARKRSWFDLMTQVEQRCTNAQLLQTWNLWKSNKAVSAHV